MNSEYRDVDVELDRQFAHVLVSPRSAESAAFEGWISKAVQRDLRPVRRLGSTAAIAARLMLVLIVVSIAAGWRMPPLGLNGMNAFQITVIALVLLGSAASLSGSLAGQMRPGMLRRVPSWVSIAGWIAAFAGGIFFLFPWVRPEFYLRRGLHCLATGLAIALLTSLAAAMIVRRGVVLDAVSMGATLGAFAGLGAALVLQYSCDQQNVAHLAVWHGGAIVLAAAVGALAGQVMNLPRARRRVHAADR